MAHLSGAVKIFYRYKRVPQWLIYLEQLRLEAIPPRLNQKLRIKYKVMAVLSSSVEFAWQAAENLSEGGVVRLLMTALQQLECLLMTTFPRTERLLMTILCSACQCFFLLCLFQLIFWAILLYYTSTSLSDSGPIFVVCHSVTPCCQIRPSLHVFANVLIH